MRTGIDREIVVPSSAILHGKSTGYWYASQYFEYGSVSVACVTVPLTLQYHWVANGEPEGENTV